MGSSTSKSEERGWDWARAISEGFLFRGAQILAWGCGVAIIVLALISVITAVGRRGPWAGVWVTDVTGGGDLALFLMALVTALGLAYCWYAGGHINVGVIKDKCSPGIRTAIDIVALLMFLILIAAVAWSVGKLGIQYIASGEHSMMMRIPFAPFHILFALVMAHFFLVLLRSLFGRVAKARGRRVEHDGLY